jgi:hypothetical protein
MRDGGKIRGEGIEGEEGGWMKGEEVGNIVGIREEKEWVRGGR